MYLLVLTLLLCVYASLIAAIPAAAPVRPSKGAVSVANLDVDLEGSGCKAKDVSVNLASDNSAMIIIFDKFIAADGPKAISTETRALCRINIGMNLPGWAFDVASADFRGFVYLEKGVEASLVSRWKWIDTAGNDLKGKVGNITTTKLQTV